MKKLRQPSVIFFMITVVWTIFATMITPLRFERTCVGITLPFPYEVHFQYIQRVHYGQIATYENESSVNVEVTNTYTVRTENGTFLIQEGTISPSSEPDGIYGAVFGVKDYCVRLLGGFLSRETKQDMFPAGNSELTYELCNEREGSLFKSDEYLFNITDAIWKDGEALRGRPEWDATGVACILVLAAAECVVVAALTVDRKKRGYSQQVSDLIAGARSEYGAEVLTCGLKKYRRYTNTIQKCYFAALSALCAMAFAVVNIATTSRAVFWLLNEAFLLALFLCALVPLCARQSFLRKLELYDLFFIAEYSTDRYPLQMGRLSRFDLLLYLCELIVLDGRPDTALELLNAAWSTMQPHKADQRLHARFLHLVLVSFLRPDQAAELLPAMCHDCVLAPYSALRRLGISRTEQRQTADLLVAYGAQNWGSVLTLTARLHPLSYRTVSLWLMRYRAAACLGRGDVLDEMLAQMAQYPKLSAWLRLRLS